MARTSTLWKPPISTFTMLCLCPLRLPHPLSAADSPSQHHPITPPATKPPCVFSASVAHPTTMPQKQPNSLCRGRPTTAPAISICAANKRALIMAFWPPSVEAVTTIGKARGAGSAVKPNCTFTTSILQPHLCCALTTLSMVIKSPAAASVPISIWRCATRLHCLVLCRIPTPQRISSTINS